jgi:hypothetical protein
MSLTDQILELLKTYGPTLLVLVIGYFHTQANHAENKERIAKLETKLLQNQIDVKKENTGLSSDDIIAKSLGEKPGP